ncbi:unnamed protein product [Protopolystoma xenopodis]|uniref:Uncharacterized protein n=1 Tax=Protopolystoma xenopodis TaxID=117903 RepID=A0A448WHJ1_9PLAT|nr:unnamed protein product [Protopolystoma xenopodis]
MDAKTRLERDRLKHQRIQRETKCEDWLHRKRIEAQRLREEAAQKTAQIMECKRLEEEQKICRSSLK